MNNKFIPSSRKIIPAGRYPAQISNFSFEEDYKFGSYLHDVFVTSYRVNTGKRIRDLDTFIFYSERENSDCEMLTNQLDEVLGETFSNIDELPGMFVDIEVSIEESRAGNKYNKIVGFAPFTGKQSDFNV